MATKRLFIFLITIILLALLSIYYPQIQTLTGHVTQQETKEEITLIRVVDGDTIKALTTEDKEITIRLLGINTPEKNMPFSSNAKELLNKYLNQTLYLEYDYETKDKYNRDLGYIFYNSKFLNLEIIELGFANSYYTDGLKYEKEFLRAEEQARKAELGIWTKSTDKCSTCIILNQLNLQAEYFILENQCSFFCNLTGWFVKDAGRNVFYLTNLASLEKEQYNSTKEVWNNDGDKFFMFDNKGLLVEYYEG